MSEAALWSWYVNRSRKPVSTLPRSATDPKLDPFLEKLAKLFPLEIAAAFTAADQFARIPPDPQRFILLVVVAIAGLVAVPQAFSRWRGVKWSVRQGRTQILVGIGAYLIFVYSQAGGLSSALGIHYPAVAGVVVVLYLLYVALYSPTPA
jgi:hypothetical protein